MKNHWKAIVTIVLVSACGFYYYNKSSSSQTTTTVMQPQEVERGDLSVSVSGSGQMEAISQVDLVSVVAGDAIAVNEVFVKNNQEVKKDQVIAVLDTQDALRDIENAKLALRSSQIKQKQVEDLYENLTKEDRWQRQTQEVDVQEQQIALEKTQEKLQDYYIKAPFDGIITSLAVEAGDSVSNTTVLASVITKKMHATVTLNEVDAAKVVEGDKAVLTFDALPDVTLSGTISRIDTIGTVSSGVVSYDAEIELDTQDDQLKPGMSVSADITVSERNNVVLVPNTAITTTDGKTTVETSQGTKEIKTGITDDVNTEVVSGLSEGDDVLIETEVSSSETASSSSSSSIFKSLFSGPGRRN